MPKFFFCEFANDKILKSSKTTGALVQEKGIDKRTYFFTTVGADEKVLLNQRSHCFAMHLSKYSPLSQFSAAGQRSDDRRDEERAKEERPGSPRVLAPEAAGVVCMEGS